MRESPSTTPARLAGAFPFCYEGMFYLKMRSPEMKSTGAI
jgi:hypothetical protein